MKNKLLMIAVVSFVALFSIILFNQWVSSQLNGETVTPAKVTIGLHNDELANTPHRPVIDPANDPLAPVVKPPAEKPAPAESNLNPPKKVYEPPIDSVLIQ